MRPTDTAGWQHLAEASVATGLGLLLSLQGGIASWLIGQLLLTAALLKWFVLLHEAGHGTLFARRRLNTLAGHLAGFWAGIAYAPWRRVHALHHRHTGWQDLDPTTATLVPRPLGRWHRALVNLAWRLQLPGFSLIYRWQNFWHLRRLATLLPQPHQRAAIRRGVFGLLLVYALVLGVVPLATLVRAFVLALPLSLWVQDFILLGQHTHRPTGLSDGQPVTPIPPAHQGVFSRSVLLPPWLSRWLVGFDLHERHHVHPLVPGYRLRDLTDAMPHAVHWATWWRATRQLSGVDFLYGRSADTGLAL